MVEENIFIADRRESTVRDIWKNPEQGKNLAHLTRTADWTNPREETDGGA